MSGTTANRKKFKSLPFGSLVLHFWGVMVISARNQEKRWYRALKDVIDADKSSNTSSAEKTYNDWTHQQFLDLLDMHASQYHTIIDDPERLSFHYWFPGTIAIHLVHSAVEKRMGIAVSRYEMLNRDLDAAVTEMNVEFLRAAKLIDETTQRFSKDADPSTVRAAMRELAAKSDADERKDRQAIANNMLEWYYLCFGDSQRNMTVAFAIMLHRLLSEWDPLVLWSTNDTMWRVEQVFVVHGHYIGATECSPDCPHFMRSSPDSEDHSSVCQKRPHSWLLVRLRSAPGNRAQQERLVHVDITPMCLSLHRATSGAFGATVPMCAGFTPCRSEAPRSDAGSGFIWNAVWRGAQTLPADTTDGCYVIGDVANTICSTAKTIDQLQGDVSDLPQAIHEMPDFERSDGSDGRCSADSAEQFTREFLRQMTSHCECRDTAADRMLASLGSAAFILYAADRVYNHISGKPID